jgi:hypothetical protein
MNRWIATLLFALLAPTVLADTQAEKALEASMLVSGWIAVAPDGSVQGYTIDRPEKIPQAVLNLIQRKVPAWKFRLDEPADMIQRVQMHLRVEATPTGDKRYTIAIADAFFGNTDGKNTDSVSYKDCPPIKYPRAAEEARVGGTVYLGVRVNRQGKVENIAAEQVNLDIRTREAQMRYFRDVLADAAIKGVSNWTYNLPTTGKHAADSSWDIILPVNFNMIPIRFDLTPKLQDDYGKWKVYVPGPRQPVPWLNDGQNGVSPDTIPAGSISQTTSSLHLATPLGGA